MRSYESKSKRRKPEIVALRRDNSNEDAFKRSVITWASTNGCPHLLFQVYNIVVGEEDSASDDDDASNSARIDAIVIKSEQGVDAPLAADQEAMSEANARTGHGHREQQQQRQLGGRTGRHANCMGYPSTSKTRQLGARLAGGAQIRSRSRNPGQV